MFKFIFILMTITNVAYGVDINLQTPFLTCEFENELLDFTEISFVSLSKSSNEAVAIALTNPIYKEEVTSSFFLWSDLTFEVDEENKIGTLAGDLVYMNGSNLFSTQLDLNQTEHTLTLFEGSDPLNCKLNTWLFEEETPIEVIIED